jgi:hypothetical protein
MMMFICYHGYSLNAIACKQFVYIGIPIFNAKCVCSPPRIFFSSSKYGNEINVWEFFHDLRVNEAEVSGAYEPPFNPTVGFVTHRTPPHI